MSTTYQSGRTMATYFARLMPWLSLSTARGPGLADYGRRIRVQMGSSSTTVIIGRADITAQRFVARLLVNLDTRARRSTHSRQGIWMIRWSAACSVQRSRNWRRLHFICELRHHPLEHRLTSYAYHEDGTSELIGPIMQCPCGQRSQRGSGAGDRVSDLPK
jgi:hypothetical protein